jgi:ATP-dependent Clp protease ATP-binding subunit ClpA
VVRESDFGDYNDKLAKSGRDVLAIAIEESRRRNQNYLAAEHLFLGSVKIEQEMFQQSMRKLGLEPNEIVKDVRDHLDLSRHYLGKGLKITFSMKSIFRLAWINSFQTGRDKIEAYDLLLAIFQEGNNIPVEVLRLGGIEPEKVVCSLDAYFKSQIASNRNLARKYDIPHYLKRLTSNLNRLVRRNKIALIPGREDEVKEVLEVLTDTIHFDSILLTDPTGLGGVAVAQNLAIRWELETNLLPEQQQEFQLLELHLEPLIPGERFLVPLENMLYELKEHRDLILFIPGIDILLGAETKFEVPTAAIDLFRSALINKSIRVIGSITQISLAQLEEGNKTLADAFRVISVRSPSEMEAKELEARVRHRKAMILQRWGITELSEEKKQAVRDAVASRDFERAFYLLSEHYGQVEGEDEITKPNPLFSRKALWLSSAIILILLLAFLLIALTAR